LRYLHFVHAAATVALDPPPLLEPAQLERYADAAVRSCLGLREGDDLLLTGDPAHRELLVALAASGYRAGAGSVDLVYAETRAQAARMRLAAEEHLGALPPWERSRLRARRRPTTCAVTVLGEGDFDAFADVPPQRLATEFARSGKARRPFTLASQRGFLRWVGMAWPTPAWACRVYPELAVDEAERRLAHDLLHFCRLGPDDPPGSEGWTTHTAALVERGRALTGLGLTRLELRGPGTRLDLALAPGSRWLGGPRTNAHGYTVAGNFPTEENFTSPDPAGTEGTFRCSRPLVHRGRVIEGIAGEFRGGRLVRLEAATEAARRSLADALAADRGAQRLGEVALVDSSSRIGRADRTYFTTLIDENAAAHIAFGYGFDLTREPGSQGRGVNRSALHLDVMIGTDDFEATGVTAEGHRVPLLAGGDWQVP